MAGTLGAYIDRLQAASPGIGQDQRDSVVETDEGFFGQLHSAGILRQLSALAVAHLLQRILLVLSWAFVGAGALNGRLDHGWLAACALALGSTVPLQAMSTWLQGIVAIGFGRLLKQRLLMGAMAIDADFIQSKGAGALMSEVLESEALDNLGATGGLATLLALLELLLVPPLLWWGAAVTTELVILAAFCLLLAVLVAHNLQLRLQWTHQRIAITNAMVEDMAAHRTRVVQQPPAEWHLAEDASVDTYLCASRRLDVSTARIEAALPRGYLLVAFAGLAPSILAGGSTMAEQALSLGAILTAAATFERFCLGYSKIAAAWAAWRIAKPLFEAAGRKSPQAGTPEASTVTPTVLQARKIGFTYPQRSEPALKACSLTVKRGDRILLQGESGSGKSTLAAVLAGSLSASEGFVLAGGLDQYTLGEAAWRRRIALVPQYHQNHLLAAPLSYNLLLSRPPPHTEQDLAEATAVCRELGLGNLLDRMPGGIHQFVGETGWRLSQGERSRIFLARALLQRADIVLLDESLGALDPENLQLCIACILRRAPATMVIAHP